MRLRRFLMSDPMSRREGSGRTSGWRSEAVTPPSYPRPMADQPSRREQAIALRNAGHSTSQIREAMGLRSGGGALRRWLKDVPPPEWTERPNAKDDLREKAIALRREGYSYREIREQVPVSKSSLSLWLRDV